MVEPAAGGAGWQRPVVVAVCLVPARRQVAVRHLGEAAAAGAETLLITADGRPMTGLPAGVRTVDLVAAERRVGVHPLLVRSPWRLLRRLLRRPKRGPSWAWACWSGSRPYRAIRPWVLWRALHRQLRPLGLRRVDHVLIVSIESWPIAWQLCHRNPDATYGWDVPAAIYDRCAAAAAPG